MNKPKYGILDTHNDTFLNTRVYTSYLDALRDCSPYQYGRMRIVVVKFAYGEVRLIRRNGYSVT